jgi:probable HAF family extracellular repeat protein
MNKRVCLMMAAVCLAVFCLAGSVEAALYKYQDINPAGGIPSGVTYYTEAINDVKQVTGYYQNNNVSPVVHGAFIWDPVKGWTLLQSLGGTNSYAHAINQQGQIVGQAQTSSGANHACEWTDPSQAPTDLGLLAGYTGSVAHAINDSGMVVGASLGTHPHACKWTAPQQPVDLGTLGGSNSFANGINNAGQIVGNARNAQGNSRACLWNVGQTTPQDLAVSLPNSCTAYAINNQGNVMGQNPVTGLGFGNAFFWNHQTGEVKNISGGYDSMAVGLSDANQVIAWGEAMSGFFPVIYWTPASGSQDLNKLVVNLPQGVTISGVSDISHKHGYIIGTDSQGHPCLLTPIASLAGLNLLLMD